MRFRRNDMYFTIAVYVVGTMVAILLIGSGLFHFRTLWGYLAVGLGTTIRVLKPLLLGFIIAYLFDPLVELYDKRWMYTKEERTSDNRQSVSKRTLPTLLTFITLLATMGIIILVVSINIGEVIGSFGDKGIEETVTHYIKLFKEMSEEVSNIAIQTPFESRYRALLADLYVQINSFSVMLIDWMIGLFKGIGRNIIPLILGIVIAFYALSDKRRLVVIWQNILQVLLPKRVNKEIRAIGRAIDYVFSGYIRGQILDAGIMTILISIALTMVGIDFAVIIGIISGLFNLIPYFGPIVGVVLAGVIGLLGGEPIKALYAALAVIALQQLDGWLIVPKIMGETVKLHPIIVLLSIVIGGELFGFIGFLIGVPVAGFIRIIVIRYMGNLFEV